MKNLLFILCLMYSTFSLAAVCPKISDLSQDATGAWQINNLPLASSGSTWNDFRQDDYAKNYHLLKGMTVKIRDTDVYCFYWAYPSYWDMISITQSSSSNHYAPAPGSQFNAENRCDSTEDPMKCAFIVSN